MLVPSHRADGPVWVVAGVWREAPVDLDCDSKGPLVFLSVLAGHYKNQFSWFVLTDVALDPQWYPHRLL
jgi:hypothetical protein